MLPSEINSAHVEFLDGRGKTLEYALKKYASGASEICISVAHIRSSGLTILKDIVRKVPIIRIIIGIDFNLTEPDALRELLKLGYDCRIFSAQIIGEEVVFHPKMYIIKREDQLIVIVGSSNLTEGGLRRNIEHSLVIMGRSEFPAIKAAVSAFEECWKQAVPLNASFVNNYESRWSIRKQAIENAQQLQRKLLPPHVQQRIKMWEEWEEKTLKFKEQRGIKENDVIICHTIEHDANNRYDTLVGIPDTDMSIKPYGWVTKGTRIFIHYIGSDALRRSGRKPGIYVVVEARDKPYYDDSIIPEWADAFIRRNEVYPHRIPTRPLHSLPCSRHRFRKGLRFKEWQRGTRHLIYGREVSVKDIHRTLIPISRSDGNKLLNMLLRKNPCPSEKAIV